MTKYKFGIEGLYDYRTFKSLKDFDLKVLAFDLRARSSQFVQIHTIIDILKQSSSETILIALKFDHDKPFMIEHVINEIVAKTSITKNQLEIWLYAQNDWVDSASVRFKVHYTIETMPNKVIKNEKFSGFLFRAFDFETNDKGVDQQKVLILMQLLAGQKFSHVLSLMPFDSFPHALVDYLGVSTFLLEVNQDIEHCYRNLDYDKLSKCFKLLLKEVNTQSF